MRLFLFTFLFFYTNFVISQNTWPKSYKQPQINLYEVIEDTDHGFLAIATINDDGNSYLLKFDANANLIWQKDLIFKVRPELWTTHFFKDRFKNTYIIGSTWDTDSIYGDAFILKLDSCYHRTKCLIYTDTMEPEQQYFAWNNDFSDSLFFIDGWGFNQFSNQFFLIDKSDLLPKSISNTSANSVLNTFYYDTNSVYLPFDDYFYLKGGDTAIGAIRTALLKLNRDNGKILYYKFFGFDENILSEGFHVFRNSLNRLFVFSMFRSIPGNFTYKEFCPLIYECDINGNKLSYKFIRNDSINETFNNVIQFDKNYFMAIMYSTLGSPSNSIQKIKFYKLSEFANVVDSFYLNSLGKNFYFQPETSGIHMLKTFDNKIMCVFLERDIDFKNPRITFVKFDENFKLDTTEYRNLKYDLGCNIPIHDTISLAGASMYYLHAETTFPLLELKKPTGIIPVAEKYKIAFYPNPIINIAYFEFENLPKGKLEIYLMDNKGTEVAILFNKNNTSAGKSIIPLEFENISSGIYYLKVISNNTLIHTIKVLKE